MNFFKELTSEKNRSIFVFLFICLSLFLINGMISVVLLTFVLTYITNKLVVTINNITKISKKSITIFIYLMIIVFLYMMFKYYIPILINQSMLMVDSLFQFYQDIKLESSLIGDIISKISFNEIKDQMSNGIKILVASVSNITSFGMTISISFLLSFFFNIEEEWVKSFSKMFLNSKFGWFFKDLLYIGNKFIKTFGVVLEAQFLIALINTVLTVACLSIIKFPNLLSLAFVIFILGLIPVAGVIISFVPLTLIGYSTGGLKTIVYVFIIICIIHMIESYILNPKLMSKKTDLPIFYTFIILIFSEHFWGVWGLILGIPTFVFLLDLIDVKSINNVKD
ncbi:AI-2E family transporter [Clostridioides mangenotii]|uniref:AI-2E family transporter n=1 Tax=Metaclostridioides mangenotii TaxID=1540 RepID=UPI001C1165B6|nr:AI-2E family transporter [Clostridioides mangenotii]MBU5308547.1 AI-2E family transporter [Clostridioides mangenotii]